MRAGTGGDEAALFALDLFRMYQRFATLKGWRWEQLALDITEARPHRADHLPEGSLKLIVSYFRACERHP